MKQVLITVILLTLISSRPSQGYELSGMQNDLAHGAVGYGITTLSYGFMKQLFLHGDNPRLEDKLFLLAMANILNFGAMMIKEASDDNKCRRSGNKNGCLDMGAAGYGMLGGLIGSGATLVFDF